VRVLIVANNLLMGGAERLALDLVGALQGQGFEFVVGSIRRDEALREAFERAGAVVRTGLARWRFDPAAPIRLARIIRRHRIDAVIVLDAIRNGMFYSFVGAAFSGRRVGRICWCHSTPGGKAGRFVPLLRAYRATGMLDAVVCVSRHLRGLLKARGLARRALVIPNGLDAAAFDGAAPASLDVPKDKHVLVQVANAVEDKDPDTLLKAAAHLAARRDDFLLLLVGRGTDSPAMNEAIRRSGAAGCVRALGHRGDVAAILPAADVFVLSTKMETFGLAVAEAMAAGLPVVASDVPAFEELFTHEREGLKVPPGDPAALADAIERLLDDADLRRRLAEAGRRRARAFPLGRMVRRWKRLLEVWRPDGQA